MMTWLPVCLAFVNPYREKAICSQTRDDGELAHLNGYLHDPGTMSLLGPFIENGEASLNGIPDIDEGFLYGLTLGVTPGRAGQLTIKPPSSVSSSRTTFKFI